LLGVLTPARWRLIAKLRRDGASKIADLARHLGRNYKNVHSDVKALMEFGIVERDADGLVSVPWDEIDVRVPLAA
jgi:predicted transcriptional regulator